MGNKKRKKNIWYVHPYAGGPGIGPAYRPYYFCQQFIEKNFIPLIICPNWHHLLYNQNEFLKNQKINGIEYFVIKSNRYSSNGFGRFFNMISFSIKLFFNKELKNNYSPDIIIVSSPHLFTVLPAYFLSKRFNCKFILEIRDIWPLSLIEIIGLSVNHPLVRLLKKIEVFAYSNADFIVTLLKNGCEYFSKFGINKEKIIYIPNGLVSNSAQIDTCNDEIIKFIKNEKNNNKFIIGYAGAHGTPNALDQLLSAVLLLKNKEINNFEVVMIGDGVEKQNLIRFCNENRIDNISFFDSVNKDRIELIIAEFDLCYIASLKKNLYKYGVSPNKLFEYMGASKPVLSSIYLDSLVRDSKCGIIAECENIADLAKKIQFMLEIDKNELKVLGQNGNKYLSVNHDIKKLADKYIELFS